MSHKIVNYGIIKYIICVISGDTLFYMLEIVIKINRMCDIVKASLPEDILNREPIIENDKVIFIVKNHISVSELSPEFELTPGATIEPSSGTVRNFTTPKKYIVTSEDGKWQKTYTVEVEVNNTINLNYDFEHVKQRVTGTEVC